MNLFPQIHKTLWWGKVTQASFEQIVQSWDYRRDIVFRYLLKFCLISALCFAPGFCRLYRNDVRFHVFLSITKRQQLCRAHKRNHRLSIAFVTVSMWVKIAQSANMVLFSYKTLQQPNSLAMIASNTKFQLVINGLWR